MYSVSWIQNGRVFQANTPDRKTAVVVFHNMRIKMKMCVRLWRTTQKGKPCLVL